ncbi:MAG: LysR family transcriptional regulator [Alphaproteobacteria bacterium]|nr:LysR family transcriptional regulator [Alphaproteobacteria bacterium]
MDWDKLRIFNAVAEAGSFTRAGEILKLSQSAVSRQIGALEQSLNVPLFHRHARGLVLTEQGEILYRSVREVVATLIDTEARLVDSKRRAQGALRVTTTVGVGSTWLAPRIKEFHDLYPEIRISLILDDMEMDLTMGEADVAIRMSRPRQPDLIQRHLMTVHFHLYAAKSYIDLRGAPDSKESLDDHALIAYADGTRPPIADVNWLLDIGSSPERARRPVFTVNNVYGIFRAAASGLGIASLPDYMVESAPELVRVLPQVEGPNIEAYLTYPVALRQSKRVAVFRDFLLSKIQDTRF